MKYYKREIIEGFQSRLIIISGRLLENITCFPQINSNWFFCGKNSLLVKSCIAEIEKFKKKVSTKRNVPAKREFRKIWTLKG